MRPPEPSGDSRVPPPASPFCRPMYLVAIAWIYVALMMAVAEAMHPAGTVLGGIVTFLLYGLAPVALVLYLLGTPMRRRARRAQEAAEAATPAHPAAMATGAEPGDGAADVEAAALTMATQARPDPAGSTPPPPSAR